MTDKRKNSGFVAAVKRLCRRGLALLIAGTVALGSTPAYALSLVSSMESFSPLQETGSSSQVGTISGTWTLDLWHYSGGYWKVGNKGSEKIRIDDEEIRALDQYLQANQQATFSVSVPAQIAELIRSGERGLDWQAEFTAYGGVKPSKLFVEGKPNDVTFTSDGKIEFSATPIFRFNDAGRTLRDYIPGMSVVVPLVDRKYGYNIYSVFGNGQSAVQGLGYYNEDDPSDTGSNAIHPSFISGKSGALQSGHAITLGTKIVDSAGYSIGSGTFAAAGACGLHFEFPVSLVFTDLRNPEDPGNGQDPGDLPGGNSGGNGNPSGNGQNNDPSGNGDGPGGPGNNGSDPGGSNGNGDDPGNNGNGDPGNNSDPNGPGNNTDPNDPSGPNGNPGSGSDPGNPADPAIPADSSDIAALDAVLDLPAVSYVGHDVEARDVSLYEVDGKTMTAARAAELGLGKSSFAIVQSGAGSIRKSGKTGAIAVFSQSGTFQVKLTATASNGLKDTDTRSIRILKTPAILEDLGGVQKENRKQSLRITVAQDPRNPVNELSIKLTDTASGESITVNKVFGGAEKAPANSSHIKHCSLFDTGSDVYFLCTELDFLTKWSDTRTLSYEIRAKDSAGGTDSKSGTFIVAPDLAPVAVIELEDAYYRKEASKDAVITPSCASRSDGDALQRTWEYRPEGGKWQSAAGLAGFTDLSFGSKKDISFLKTGVGPFAVRLTVKDVWTEETLPEYITAADYRSASAEKSSHVDNVAPRVSLDLLKSETAEVFLLCDTDQLRAEVLSQAPSIKAALLAEGIAAEVRADFRGSKAGERTGTVREILTGGTGGRELRDSEQQLYHDYFAGMWQGGNIAADSRCSYLLTPTVQVYTADPRYSIHTYPFTLSAMDREGKTLWRTTVTRSILNSPSYLRDASWGFDADGTYLYLTDGGKTALFDIRTGAYVTTLAAALGPFNLVTAEHLYTFKDDGIWRMDRKGGSLKQIYNAQISCPAFVGGRVNFLAKLDLGKGLGLYRGVFEPAGETVRCSLLGGSLGGYARDAQGLAIDASGAVFVRSGGHFYAYGADNALIKQIPLVTGIDRIESVFPVWSGDGKVRYLGLGGNNRVPKGRETWCCVYGVYTDEVYEDVRRDGEDFLNYGSPVVYAMQDENGAVGVYFGCDYVYATGERYLQTAIFSFKGTFRNPMGFPMEEAYQNFRFAAATANLNGSADIKQIAVSAESPADEEARLKAANLSYDKNYTYYAALGGLSSKQAVAAALEGVAEAVKRQKEQGENAAVFSGSGSLTRSISLAPDTTYFYEYETTAKEDLFSVQAALTAPAGMAAGSGFAVAASHAENFDDGAIEPFFTVQPAALDAGRCRIAHLRTRDAGGSAPQKGTAYPVSFTVPAGYKAVLQTDYAYDCYSDDPLAKQLLLARDGGAAIALDIPSAGRKKHSGTYMHDALLESGRYELTCLLQENVQSGGKTSTFWLDNLTVYLVKEGEASEAAGMQDLAVNSSLKGEGTLRRVAGSFTTPKQVLHFAPYETQKIAGLSNAYASVTEDARGYVKMHTLDLALPAGVQALKAVFTGTGKGGSTTNSSGRIRYYNASWSFDEGLAGVNTLEKDGTMTLYAMPENVRFAYRNLTGSHRLTAAFNSYYGARAAFTGLTMHLSKPGVAVPAALQEGRFFEHGGALFAEDLVFSGSGRIALNVSDGDVVRGLRIWTVAGAAEDVSLACGWKDASELSGWTVTGTSAQILPFKAEKEEPARVYAKGETINYSVFYGDWEADPSKKQHWVYTHEPLSDGLHPQAGKDLGAPITKFWADGKYTVSHWQEDSTGTAAYDKPSNRVEITFYIQSGPSNDAPWVKKIATDPGTVKAGDGFTVTVSVDDKDKDPLNVTIEVYKDSGSKPIGTKTVKDLKPDGAGNYPEVVLSGLPKAEPGTYDIVVTVSDGFGADVDTLRFKVKEERTLTGSVTHTPAWEANRIAWNKAKAGTDAVRAENVFWPGETLVLNALVGGEVLTVDAKLLEFPQYTARLTRGTIGADEKIRFAGQLWHSSMLQTIGTAKPVPATVRFTAKYTDGSTLTWDVAILFDQSSGSYYQLHRNY